MTYLKAGASLALAFATGGGVTAYWFASSGSEQGGPPADEVTEVPEVKTVPAGQRERMPQEIQNASRLDPSLHSSNASRRNTDEEDAEGELDGQSAGDVLWALEQAYQDQERRIRLLEATLLEQIQSEAEEEEPNETIAEVHDPVLDERYSHVQSDQQVQREAVAREHEPAPRVVYLNQPVEEAAAEESPAAQVAQQVVVVNHYQPVFVTDRTPPRASSRDRGLVGGAVMGGLEQRRSQARQSFSQRPAPTNSWVASGFDIYSR